MQALWDVSGAYQVQMAMTLVLVSAKTPLLASVSDSALALALAKVGLLAHCSCAHS